jgi:hypothetical protein
MSWIPPDMVPPSSPWSRPNPPGGLRPDLTPAAGAPPFSNSREQAVSRSNPTNSSLYGFRGLPASGAALGGMFVERWTGRPPLRACFRRAG